MAIKTKYTSPTINEFSPNDIIINVSEGALFFKSHNKLFRLAGDDVGTEDTQEAGIFYIGMDANPPGSSEETFTSWGALQSNSPGLITAPTFAVNTDVKADLHVGAQQGPRTSNNPSKPRIAIQPPAHTGATFNLYARDNTSHANLDLFYGDDSFPYHNNNIFTCDHLGHFSIGGRYYLTNGGNNAFDPSVLPINNLGTFSVVSYHPFSAGNNVGETGYSMTSINNIVAQGNNTTDKWYLIGWVGMNNGFLNIKGILAGHTPPQGDAQIDITYSSRDDGGGDGAGGFSSNAMGFTFGNAAFPNTVRYSGLITGEVGTASDIEVFHEQQDHTYNPAGLPAGNRKWIYLRTDQYSLCNLDFKTANVANILFDGSFTETDPSTLFDSGAPEHVLSTHNENLVINGNGDVRVILNADRDNSGETGNPYIHFKQDGEQIDALVGLVGDYGRNPANQPINGGWQNGFMIDATPIKTQNEVNRPSPIQFVTSGSAKMSVTPNGVGIGDIFSTSNGGHGANNPEFPFEVIVGANYNGNQVPSAYAGGDNESQVGTPAYHVARMINNYTGTDNDGNGLRIKLGSGTSDAGISTSRKFLLFENGRTVDGSYIQGYINGEGQTTRGVNYGTSSDKRLKENIVDTKFTIEDLMKVKVRDFNWIGSTTLTHGFIAQELIKVYPLAVSHPHDDLVGDGPLNHEETWTVDYGKITPLLTKAIQDQQKMIEELQKELKEIKNGLSRK